jgi:hypothetical protein
VTATADVRVSLQEVDLQVRIDEIAGLAIHPGAVAVPGPDLATKDQGLCPGARRGQAAFDDELVEALPRGPNRGLAHVPYRGTAAFTATHLRTRDLAARHPVLMAFLASFALGIAYVVLEVQDPDWLIGLLSVAFFGFGLGGPILLLLGWLAKRFRPEAARIAQIVGAAWTGFPAGFLIYGYATCAFCLSG